MDTCSELDQPTSQLNCSAHRTVVQIDVRLPLALAQRGHLRVYLLDLRIKDLAYVGESTGWQPQPELPVVAAFVDDGIFENEDFVLAKVLLFDAHARVPEPLGKGVAARMCSILRNIALAPVEKQRES